jgi:hypothetical protein
MVIIKVEHRSAANSKFSKLEGNSSDSKDNVLTNPKI